MPRILMTALLLLMTSSLLAHPASAQQTLSIDALNQVVPNRVLGPSCEAADFDCVNGVTAVDLSIWLTLFFGATPVTCCDPMPSADINGVNGVTAGDLADWLGIYFSGLCLESQCP